MKNIFKTLTIVLLIGLSANAQAGFWNMVKNGCVNTLAAATAVVPTFLAYSFADDILKGEIIPNLNTITKLGSLGLIAGTLWYTLKGINGVRKWTTKKPFMVFQTKTIIKN